MPSLENIITTVFIGAFFSLVFILPTIKIAKRLGLIDDPAKHIHPAILHKKPIPRAGGLPIYLSILIGSFILLSPLHEMFIVTLLAGAVVVIVGLVDDKYDLSPYVRFVFNIICASMVVFSGITIPFITNPFGGIFRFEDITVVLANTDITISVAQILAVIWIVWIMNMLNWSKGVDGQMPGITAISTIIIGIASLRFSVLENINIQIATLAFLTAGASLGFLLVNFHPSKILPGYSSTILGFLIGILSISSGVKMATAILVMGVPMADALFTIIRRIVSKKSPFWHDKGHLHHLLLDYGWSQRHIAVFYWIMSILLGALALSLSSKGKLFAILLVIVVVSAFIISLRFFMKLKKTSELT